MLTDMELAAIVHRQTALRAMNARQDGSWAWLDGIAHQHFEQDVPALLAEVRRQRPVVDAARAYVQAETAERLAWHQLEAAATGLAYDTAWVCCQAAIAVAREAARGLAEAVGALDGAPPGSDAALPPRIRAWHEWRDPVRMPDMGADHA